MGLVVSSRIEAQWLSRPQTDGPTGKEHGEWKKLGAESLAESLIMIASVKAR
jgi:hypothetical protein